jgi:hypothetical protein
MPKLRALIAALALSLPVLAAAEAPQAMPAGDATQVDRVLEPGWHFAIPSQAQAAARGALQLLTPVGTPVAGIVKVAGATAVFEPAAPLAGCTRYTLQLLGTPAPRALRSSFTTVCSTWSEPVEIDDAHTAHQVDRPASGAEVVAGKEGHAVAAWFQSNGQRNAIFASRYAAQTDFWSAPRTIDFNGGGAADVPALVADGQGRVTAAWFQALGGRTAIFACRLDAGGGCAAPVRLDDPGVRGNATNPQLAADDLGNVVAVWQQPDGHHTAIFAARWTQAQQRWLPAQALDRSPANAYDVVIAAMGGGGFVSAWEQGKRRHESIWASTLPSPSASWRAPRRVSPAGVRALHPALAMDPRGGAAVAWVQGIGRARRIAATRLDAFMRHEHPAIGMASGAFPGAALAPALVVDAAGNITLAWEQADAQGRDAILGSRMDGATRHWSAAQRIDNPRLASAGNPVLAVDPAGNVTCAWYQDSARGMQVQAARLDPEATRWSDPVELSDPRRTIQASLPALAVDSAGSVTVVWQQYNGWRTIVMASRLP